MAPITVYRESRRPGRCRSCGARIEWAIVVGSEKWIPIDADAAPLETTTDLIDGRTIERVDRTHFATCPDARTWRRKSERKD